MYYRSCPLRKVKRHSKSEIKLLLRGREKEGGRENERETERGKRQRGQEREGETDTIFDRNSLLKKATYNLSISRRKQCFVGQITARMVPFSPR